ncbi:apolipoprotein N-acyltransferase [Candidatus Termititenax persephonae]|uniref:Apolipoprotein N-acyltransferase n=1 Tax=Candidatus Termititenax persephonae TaxID=2218525 RepID=A0A388TES4_9BACT|nr:apolipoprotein N-acyltransferase [Candidatus Termititenax persephonae]
MLTALNIFLVCGSAWLTTLAFPPHNLFGLAFGSLLPFFGVIYREPSYKNTFLYALLFGLVFYLRLLVSLLELRLYVSPVLIFCGWLFLALAQALFIAVAILLGKFIQRHPVFKGFPASLTDILGYAFAWVFLDWLRSLGGSGFTLGGLAYSQYLFTDFIQLARLTGPYGLTLILVLLNVFWGVLLARLIDQRQNPKITRAEWIDWGIAASVLLLATGLIILGGGLTIYFQNRQTAKPVERKLVTVFQPAVPQEDKLSLAAHADLKTQYLEDIRAFSQTATTDLLVLPETILGEFLLNNKEFMFALRDALDFSIIFGVPRQDELSPDFRYYNSVALVNRYGGVTILHDKKYLVPFGEYLPGKFLFSWLVAASGFFDSEYTTGRKDSSRETGYAAAICFESTFPYQTRDQIGRGGRLLLVLTNDAWFGQAPFLDMHLSCAVLRAVENNRYAVQSANTGRSAIIDNHGRILRLSSLNAKEWLTAETVLLTRKTIYTYFGELAVYLALVFFCLYFYLLLFKEGKGR